MNDQDWLEERSLSHGLAGIFGKDYRSKQVVNFILLFPSGDLSRLGPRAYHMKTTCFSRARVWILLVFVGSLIPLMRL